MFTPRIRQVALTTHVVVSVGWLGAVAAFLALSIAGLTSDDATLIKSSYVAMNVIGAAAIVPLGIGALLSGVIQSLGTPWGLFRYYWVVMKLALSVVAVLLLVLHQFTAVATAAERASGTSPGIMSEIGGLGSQLVVDAGGAILLLLVITTLSVFKPWGRTSYGNAQLAREANLAVASVRTMSPTLRAFLIALGVIVTLLVVLHLAGGGMRHG
jgi:hypothetical protein